MVKTKIVETVEEYDENGKLLKRTVTEKESNDDSAILYTPQISPWCPWRDTPSTSPYTSPYGNFTCSSSSGGEK